MKKILLILMILSVSVFADLDELEILLMQDEIIEEEYLGRTEIEESRFEAIVKEIRGQGFVRYGEDESWRLLYVGAEIKQNAMVVSLDSSEVIIELEDFTIINIKPATRVVFTSLSKDVTHEQISETSLNLLFGKVYSNVRKSLNPGSKYEIEISGATAGVRGTEFLTWNNDSGKGIKVYDGTVEVRSTVLDKVMEINRQQFVEIDKRGNLGKIRQHNEEPPQIISESEQKIKITPGDMYKLKNIEIEEIEPETNEREMNREHSRDIFDDNVKNFNENIKGNLTVDIE